MATRVAPKVFSHCNLDMNWNWLPIGVAREQQTLSHLTSGRTRSSGHSSNGLNLPMSGICETAVKGLADSQPVHGTERALPACLPA